MKLKRIKNLFRHYFDFTRQERNGILVLCIILFLLLTVNFIIDKIPISKPTDYSELFEEIKKWEDELAKQDVVKKKSLFKFDPNTIPQKQLDSLELPQKVKNTMLKFRNKGGKFYKPEDFMKIYGVSDSIYNKIEKYIVIKNQRTIKINTPKTSKKITPEYFYFDPNTINESELLQLGFNKFQVRNMKAYLNKGGKFIYSEDILKIYGVDTTFYQNIKPWIKIKKDKKFENLPQVPEFLELNKADSAALVKLRGIGAVFANRIIKYRQFLGGYYKKQQLLEVYNLTEETYSQIEMHLKVDVLQIKRISLNFSDVYKLSKHPYISKAVANKIIEFRTKHGSFSMCNELIKFNLLSQSEFEKIKPYIKVN